VGAVEEGGFYTLSAGETISQKKHESLVKQLTAAGQHPVVLKEMREKDVYRLVSECQDDVEAAKELRNRLAHKVKDAFVTRDGDSFCVVAGSFLSEEDALKGQKQLARKNLELKVVKTRVNVPVWSITSGEYGDMREAEAAAGRLAGKGIAAAVRKVDSRKARPAAKRVVMELTIEFDFDKQNIKPEYQIQLGEMARFLKSSSRISALIEGHTDGIGGDAYNFRLSNRRAQSVKQALVKLGVPSGRVSIEGFGKTRPVADNATAEGRKRNRRAVTIILTSD
jgi:outer membrane protein OmpA-like peptidoglycan-associated protein